MKPRPIELAAAASAPEVVERVLQIRFEELCEHSRELGSRDPQGLHDFRIACKRLRYALERFTTILPALEEPAERLARVQDALGEAHDRDVLLSIVPPAMGETAERLQREREAYVDRASLLWKELRLPLQSVGLFQPNGETGDR